MNTEHHSMYLSDDNVNEAIAVCRRAGVDCEWDRDTGSLLLYLEDYDPDTGDSGVEAYPAHSVAEVYDILGQ